ncbi:hypothetical protein DRO58_02535 [Candidatus Bathyarchaeota archaeon]|nr:MAG: hypothetical protein DRO58_02535 [Candidatus Bathyarchaeota archaeon]
MKIVKKGTKEFEAVKLQYLSLFRKSQPGETIVKGILGVKSTQAINKLPMPFGCPALELYIWFENEEEAKKKGYGKMKAYGFFCGRIGCICAPARSDMEEEYPDYCPPAYPEDWYEDEWEEDE